MKNKTTRLTSQQKAALEDSLITYQRAMLKLLGDGTDRAGLSALNRVTDALRELSRYLENFDQASEPVIESSFNGLGSAVENLKIYMGALADRAEAAKN